MTDKLTVNGGKLKIQDNNGTKMQILSLKQVQLVNAFRRPKKFVDNPIAPKSI